ncbi:unnamed protein product, partial [Thlaspi arvense]
VFVGNFCRRLCSNMSGRKETVLDLAKFVDKGVQVKLTGGRQVTGTLKGYDQLLNLVLDEAVEFVRDHDDPLKTTDQTRRLGLIVCRGTAVMLVSPTDGTEEIANPFVQPEAMKSVTTKLKLLRPVLTLRCSYSSTDQTQLLTEFTRFCYQRDLPRALRAMDSLQSHSLWADSETYSELIKCCLSQRAVHEGNQVCRVRPNVYTYSSVLRSCNGLSDVRMVHCGIIKEGLDSDVYVRSALIDVFAKL